MTGQAGDAVRIQEPMCCGEPMVHNSWTREYECSDAYFTLVDEGWREEHNLDRLTAEDVGPELADTLAHWRASRIPDTAGIIS